MKRVLELGLFGLPPLVALLVSPLLARGLGPEGRGELAIVLAVYSVGLTLGSFGQPEVYSADLRANDASRKRTLYAVTVSSCLVAAIVGVVALMLLHVDAATAIIGVVLIPFAGLGLMWRYAALAQGRLMVLAIQNAAPSLLRAALIVAIFAVGGLTPLTAAASTQAGVAIGLVILGVAVLRRRRDTRAGVLSGRAVTRSLIEGTPIVGLHLCMAVVLRADLFALNGLSTAAEVGYYAAVVGVTESALALSAAFKNRVQVACYGPNPLTAVRRELFVMVAIALSALAVGEAVAYPFTVILFGEEFRPAVSAFRILMVAAVAQTLADCGQGILAIQGRRSSLFVSSAAGAVLTLALLPFAVPQFGAAGAGAVKLVVYMVLAAIVLAMALRELGRSQPMPPTEAHRPDADSAEHAETPPSLPGTRAGISDNDSWMSARPPHS